MNQPIKIDGSIKEGGGQIIRIATALSVLLQKPIEINNIRAGRKKPGLAAQHLKGLQLARDLCSGKLIGDEIGSTCVHFTPGKIKALNVKVDVGTAGSVVLLLQISLPITMFAPGESTLELIGGTNADLAPQIDYLLDVFQQVASRFGMKFQCDIVKRGFFPKGGGIVRVKTFPTDEQLRPIEMVDRGEVRQIIGSGFVAGNLPDRAISEMKSTAQRLLKQKNLSSSVTVVREPDSRAVGIGSGIILATTTSNNCILSGSGLGRRGTTSGQVSAEAVECLLTQIENDKRCVDEYLQDQLIILMALANGKSRIRTGALTLHTETGIEITEIMVGKKLFNVIHDSKDGNIIECDGIGLNPNLRT